MVGIAFNDQPRVSVNTKKLQEPESLPLKAPTSLLIVWSDLDLGKS